MTTKTKSTTNSVKANKVVEPKKQKQNKPLISHKKPLFRNYEFDVEEGVFVNMKEEMVLIDGPANETGKNIFNHVAEIPTILFVSMKLQLLYPNTKIFIVKVKEQTKEEFVTRVYAVDSLASLKAIPTFNF